MTNREYLENSFKRHHSGEPPSGQPNVLLRHPQMAIMALLVVAVLLFGLVHGNGKTGEVSVTAEVVLCGGPAPGACRVDSYGVCPPCVNTSYISVHSLTGQYTLIGRAPLQHGRQVTIKLKPALYSFQLVATGKHHRSVVLQTRRFRVRAGHSNTVRFVLSIP